MPIINSTMNPSYETDSAVSGFAFMKTKAQPSHDSTGFIHPFWVPVHVS